MKKKNRAEQQAIEEILDMQSSGVVWWDKRCVGRCQGTCENRERLLYEEYIDGQGQTAEEDFA